MMKRSESTFWTLVVWMEALSLFLLYLLLPKTEIVILSEKMLFHHKCYLLRSISLLNRAALS